MNFFLNKDKPNMTIKGIEYKTIDGKIIPYSGTLDAVLDCLIFPTAQGIQLLCYIYNCLFIVVFCTIK